MPKFKKKDKCRISDYKTLDKSFFFVLVLKFFLFNFQISNQVVVKNIYFLFVNVFRIFITWQQTRNF